MDHGDSADEESLRARGDGLTKCQPGAVNGMYNYCWDPACPCVAGEGDCNSNAHCIGGSICGHDIGARFGVSWVLDFCVMPHCLNGIQDNGETGVDCGIPECGACLCDTGPMGGGSYCTDSCKCSSGEGDCDSNLQCEAGLYCASKVGEYYGQAATNDVCIPLECKDGIQNNGETGVDCGGQCPPCQTPTAETKRASVSSSGGQSNDVSWLYYGISGDASRVVFSSPATNLVTGDTNGVADVFMHIPGTGQTTRVSTTGTGGEANGVSYYASISSDGRYVAFVSEASNLVSGDTNGVADLFVKDVSTGAVLRVAAGNAPPINPQISANGLYVAFASDATNLVAGDTNGVRDIFLVNRISLALSRLSLSATGEQGNGISDEPSIDAVGTYVAFRTSATNFTTDDTNNAADIFVKNRTTGQIQLVTVNTTGTASNSGSLTPSISGNGNVVAFRSNASNLVANDTNKTWDIFARDMAAGITTRVNVSSSGEQANGSTLSPWLSSDGNYVAFASMASNLVAGDTNERTDVFVHDRSSATTTRVPGGNDKSEFPVMAHGGGFVVFRSNASDLVAGDTNGVSDIFVAPR
jgi:Tol biopolymer transport system component